MLKTFHFFDICVFCSILLSLWRLSSSSSLMSHSLSSTSLNISSHTYFPQSFLNNIKNQLNKIHIAVDNHRDIYLCRNQVKNRRNEKTTAATYITYYHALHICMWYQGSLVIDHLQTKVTDSFCRPISNQNQSVNC